jgi:predicted RecA/RadA family phage recombinase
MAKLIKEAITVNVVPAADVEAGSMVAIGELVGVANYKIPAGDLGAVDLNGVYAFTKKAADGGAYPAIEAGSKIKIDADGLAVGVEGTGTYFGFSVEPSPEDVETVKVKLFPELNALLSQG